MFPMLEIDYFPNRAATYFENCCQLTSRKFPRFVHSSNFNNLMLGKLSRSRSGSNCRIHSSLIQTVLRVIFMGSWKQVIGINARRVIALVTNQRGIGNWSVSYLPRNPMRHFTLIGWQLRTLASTHRNYLTVPRLGPISAPHPTSGGFIFKNLAPESFVKILTMRHIF